MNQAANVVVGGLGVLVLLASGLWYVFADRGRDELVVDDPAATWGTADAEATEVSMRLAVRNHGKIEVRLVGVEHELYPVSYTHLTLPTKA